LLAVKESDYEAYRSCIADSHLCCGSCRLQLHNRLFQDIQRAEPNISEPNAPPSPDRPPTVPADSFEIVGTVVHKAIEGGFYAIDGDDGRKYDPINLPESFRKDGLRVIVTARRRTDAMSLHMYGAIIEIVNIAAE